MALPRTPTSGHRFTGIAGKVRSLSPRRIGGLTVLLAVFLVLSTYLLRATLNYPAVLLDTPALARALVEQSIGTILLGFVCLLLGGGLLSALALTLAAEMDPPAQRRALLMGGAAGMLWAMGALLGLVLMPLWGHAPAGLTATLAALALVTAEIAAPLLLVPWTAVVSRQLQAWRVLGWAGAIGLLLVVVRSLLWGLNALMPVVSGFYGAAEILDVLAVLGASLWLLWLMLLGFRMLAHDALGGARAARDGATTESTGTMNRRRLLHGALGVGVGLVGAAFIGARTGVTIAASPELTGDDIPAEPSLIAAGYYLIALFFLRVVHPINSVAVLARQTAPSDTTPPPASMTMTRLGVTIEPVDANGVPAERITTPGVSSDRWILYIHGGGWAVAGTNDNRAFVGRLSKAVNAGVLYPNYRLIPEHPFPAALNDCVAAYR